MEFHVNKNFLTGSSRFGSRGSGIGKFSDILKVVFSREPDQAVSIVSHQKVVSKHYKVATLPNSSHVGSAMYNTGLKTKNFG